MKPSRSTLASECQHQAEWLSLCWTSMQWVGNIWPFSRFLNDVASFEKSIFFSVGMLCTSDSSLMLHVPDVKHITSISGTNDSTNTCSVLHSLLYTHLIKTDIRTAVETVDSLIVKANAQVLQPLHIHLLSLFYRLDMKIMSLSPQHHAIFPSDFMRFLCPLHFLYKVKIKGASTVPWRAPVLQALNDPDMVPGIRNKAIRSVVQTFARFMVAYFVNQPVYIFPPHNPLPLQAVHLSESTFNDGIIVKEHSEISYAVRNQRLSGIWTCERALEYLLLTGLVCEATWFVERLGNWKVAFQLATAHCMHRSISPCLYVRQRIPLTLPGNLQPEEILFMKLTQLIEFLQVSSDMEYDRHRAKLMLVLEYAMLAGMIGGVEVAPRLLRLLLVQLKEITMQFRPIVSDPFYLPYPPVYCPQPTLSSKDQDVPEVTEEWLLREKASLVVRQILVVMDAARISVPALRYYVQQLARIAQFEARQFECKLESPCERLPEFLQNQLVSDSVFYEALNDSSVSSVVADFRDFCSLLWLLHVRDKLSYSLRMRAKYLSSKQQYTKDKCQHQAEWLSLCWTSMQWVGNIWPFSRFLNDGASFEKILLSNLLEFIPSRHVAELMADFLHNPSNSYPEIQERINQILHDWQSIIIQKNDDGQQLSCKSIEGECLSAYFCKQQQLTKMILQKKKQCFGHYEEFVFDQADTPLNLICIGSRPFESKNSYFEFLDMFFSISFTKVIDRLQAKDRNKVFPLLAGISKMHVNKELQDFISDVAINHQSSNTAINISASTAYPMYDKENVTFDNRPSAFLANITTGLYEKLIHIDRKKSAYCSKKRIHLSHTHNDNCKGGSRWKLIVNFGKRYIGLQQVMEWMEDWVNDTSSDLFSHCNSETSTNTNMTSLRLHVPTQMIVLSLWLLEKKYTSTLKNGKCCISKDISDKAFLHLSTISDIHSMKSMNINCVDNTKDAGPLHKNVLKYSCSKSWPTSLDGSFGRLYSHSSLEMPQIALSDIDLEKHASTNCQKSQTYFQMANKESNFTETMEKNSVESDDFGRIVHLADQPCDQLSHRYCYGSVENVNVMIESVLSKQLLDNAMQSSPLHGSLNGSPKENLSANSALSSGRKETSNECTVPTLSQANKEDRLLKMLHNSICRDISNMFQVQHKCLSSMMNTIDGRKLSENEAVGGQRLSVHGNNANMYHVQSQPSRTVSSCLLCQTAGNTGENVISQVAHDHIYPHPSSLSNAGLPAKSTCPVHETQCYTLPQLPTFNVASNFVSSQTQTYEENAMKVLHSRLKFPKMHKYQHQITTMSPGGRFGNLPANDLHAISYPTFSRLSVPSCPKSAMPRLLFASSRFQFSSLGLHRVSSFASVPNVSILKSVYHQHRTNKSASCVHQNSFRLLSIQSGYMKSWQSAVSNMIPPVTFQSYLQKNQKVITRAECQTINSGGGTGMVVQQKLSEPITKLPNISEDIEKNERVRDVVGSDGDGTLSDAHSAEKQDAVQQATLNCDSQHTTPPAKGVDASDAKVADGVMNVYTATESPVPLERAESGTESSTIHNGYIIPLALNEEKLITETDMAFHEKLQQYIQKQIDLESCPSLFQHKLDLLPCSMATAAFQNQCSMMSKQETVKPCVKDVGIDPIEGVDFATNEMNSGISLPPDVLLGLKFSDKESESVDVSAKRYFLNVVDVHGSSIFCEDSRHAPLFPDNLRTASNAYIPGHTEVFHCDLSPKRCQNEKAVSSINNHEHCDQYSTPLLSAMRQRSCKTSMMRQLNVMNERMSAMDQMLRNIDNDFLMPPVMSKQKEQDSQPEASVGGTEFAPQHLSSRESEKNALSKNTTAISDTVVDLSVESKNEQNKMLEHSSNAIVDQSPNQNLPTFDNKMPKIALPTSSVEDFMKHLVEVEGSKMKDLMSNSNHSEIQRWMAEQYSVRQQHFSKHRHLLREKETKPYKTSSQISTDQLRTLKDNMTERRTARNFEATKKRLSEAEHLIGASLVLARDIRSEVDLLHTRSTSLEKSKSRSPPRTTTIGGKSTNTDCYFYRQKESALTVNEKSRRSEPVLSQGKIEFDDHNAVVKPRSEHQDIHDAELNGGDGVMDDYIRKNIHARTRPDPVPDEPTKRYRPMPFTRLVNVGHHDFHHYADCNHPDEKYMKLAMDERKAQRSASAIPHSNKSAKLSVHGTEIEKHVRKLRPVGPRYAVGNVKSYADRLKEVRPHRRYATPIIPRDTVHQTEKQITRTKGVKTYMSARKLRNKPVCYTQQLQQINAPFKKGLARKLISSTPIQSLEFGRLSEEDTCSIFSDWNVEDNVHQLLYKDVIPKKNPVADGQDVLMFSPWSDSSYYGTTPSDYYDAIMDVRGISDHDHEVVEDNQRLNTNECLSLRSGSVLSVIDWDAVDTLIEDS